MHETHVLTSISFYFQVPNFTTDQKFFSKILDWRVRPLERNKGTIRIGKIEELKFASILKD